MANPRSCRGLYSTVVILLLFSPYMSWCLLSDYKICGDAECESLMCRVQATKDHHGKDCRFLSFTRGDTIFVYHKLTGRRQDLWAGSIDKQFGYFPKDAVKEEQVYATAEKVLQTQKFDFFCLDENGYPTDSSHLEMDEDGGNVDDDNQGNPNSETNHGSLDAKLQEDGSYSTSQDPFQLNHQGALSENNGQTEDSVRTLENMEPGDGSGDGHGPNKQGGSPSSSSSSSSSFGSTVTGLLGMQRGSDHAEIENTPEEDEGEAKAEEADNSLATSVTQWLGYGEQEEIDETTLGQDKEITEMGDADAAFTSTVNSWLGYGNERTEDAEKSVKAEIEIVEEEEEKETFRSRKLAIDLESNQLQGEELAVPGTFDWLGDTLSSTIGFGLTRQDSGLEKKTDKEEVENTNKDVKPSPSHSWYDIGIGDVLGFGKNAGKVDSTVESGLKAKGDDMEKHTELQSIETSPSQKIQDMREPTNLHNVETSLSPPPPSPPQQQPSENDIITDKRVETKTKVLAAGVNSEEDSVSNISDFPLEQSREESKIKTELRDTLSLNGNSDIDDVLDGISMLITDNESEVANLDEVKALQISLEKDPQTVPSSDSFLSKLDNVLSLDQEDDYDDNGEGGESKEEDEKDSAKTKHGNDPDLTQDSLERENDEVSVEAVFDGKADKHEEGKTETGTLNPGIAQTNTAGDQIFASTQFHDTIQQNQGDKRYARDGKETVQATDDGLHNTFEAEELNSSHREALSDSVARKTEETEMNEIKTHVDSAATRVEQAVEMRTNAALDQLSSKEAGISQQTLRYSEKQSEENKSSFTSHDIHTPGIVDRHTTMDTIDQSSGPPPMSGSAERSGNDTDGVNLDHSKIGAVTDDEHPITEAQTAEEGAVFDRENFYESAEPSVSLFEIVKNPKSTTVKNTISDTVFSTEHTPFSNLAKIKDETQVEMEGKEMQEGDEETEIVVKLQIAEDNKQEENIDEGEDKEGLDGNRAIKNHSSLIRDNESKVSATEGMNQDQITLDEPQREGESNESMVTVKATDAEAAGAGEANSIEDNISHLRANSRGESLERPVVETEVKREYIDRENHVDKVNGLFVSQTGILKQEEDNVDKTSPAGLSNDIVIDPKETNEEKHSDLDTAREKSPLNNVVIGPTNKFQPDNIDQLHSGVATFLEPSINEVTKSDHQSDITDQGTAIVEEGENINSENYDISITEQSDSMVTNSDDIRQISASHNGAVFSEQAVVIDSLKPTPTVENKDTVRPESVGGAFGMFKNALTYFSPTPSAENRDLKPNPDTIGMAKTFKPGGSLSSEQVTHVIADTTPGKGVVSDTPASSSTLQLPHQDTALPLPSAQYQSQSSSYSRSQHPTPEVPIKVGTATVPKKHKALRGHFSVEETALLTELFGRHKLQWLDFILSNPESMGESMDNDRSILLDMESLLLHHLGKLAQRQDNTEQTGELPGLKKLQILLARVKDILNTGKSEVVNTNHEDDTSCISTPCLSTEKDKGTAIEGEPRKTKGSSESVSEKTPTRSGEIRQLLYFVHHSTEYAFLHILEVRELLKQLIVQVVLVLPDDIRPGPDLYGLPWEPVIITSLVGLGTILMFSCRFYNSVKSRMHQGKERRVAKHIADLLNDKCQVLEAVSKVQTEYDELEGVLRDSGVLAQTEKAEQLELQFSQMECSNKDLERDLEVLKEQLKIHGEHRVQQERTIAELEESIKASEKETKELQAQEEEAVTTLKIYNMNSERLQRNLESAEEENILLQESNTQLSEQMEGWVERVSELEDEMRRCEAAHTVMQQDVDTKDHRIKYLTDRLLGMKALDSDLEQEDEGERDASNGDENERHLQKVQKLIYAAKLNADLKSMDEDKDRTFAKLNDEIQAKEELQQGIKDLEEERSSLQTQAEDYTEQVQRLQQKLLIMTEMYQENELKLHRLLTVEEKERLQKEEKLNKADKNISLAMEELDNYRQQAENMEEELEKTKQSYQTQISSHEKKAHNNWLAARSAERDLADIRRENTLLRQKLTDTQFKLDTIDKDPYALDSLARPLPFRGERSPYGPSPLGRPASETRPFLSPPTLMEGPCSRLSPRVPRVPLEPPAGGREMMERSSGPHSDGSNSPTWERDHRGPPPPPGHLGPPGYMFPEPGPPMYRRPPPMGLPLPHLLHPGLPGPMPLGPPRGHPAALGPPGPPMPMDMANQPRPADLRPEVDGRMGGDTIPPGPPFPRRGPHGPLPLDFYPPPSRGPDGGPRMQMWRPPPHPGVMFPLPRMLPPGGPPPLLLPHQPSSYPPGVRPHFPPPTGAHLPPPPSSSTDPRISSPEQTPPLPSPSEQAPSPHHLI